jgi:hypothetical protein
MSPKQKKAKMHINTLIDMEETMLRLKIKEDNHLALQMLCAFRPNASLRQIKNSSKEIINYVKRNN